MDPGLEVMMASKMRLTVPCAEISTLGPSSATGPAQPPALSRVLRLRQGGPEECGGSQQQGGHVSSPGPNHPVGQVDRNMLGLRLACSCTRRMPALSSGSVWQGQRRLAAVLQSKHVSHSHTYRAFLTNVPERSRSFEAYHSHSSCHLG